MVLEEKERNIHGGLYLDLHCGDQGVWRALLGSGTGGC